MREGDLDADFLRHLAGAAGIIGFVVPAADLDAVEAMVLGAFERVLVGTGDDRFSS